MKIAEYLTKPISTILKFLLRRLVFVTVAIILQMIWMTYMVVVIGEYSKAIEWVFRIFSITVVIYIANKDDNPAYTAYMDYSSSIGSGTYRIGFIANADGHTVTRYSNERTY